jgi:hypothetical protein
MRKLAREAVIFMLFGALLSAVSAFAYLHHGQAKDIRAEWDALKGECNNLRDLSIPETEPERRIAYEYWISNRFTCSLVFGGSPYLPPSAFEGVPKGYIVGPPNARPPGLTVVPDDSQQIKGQSSVVTLGPPTARPPGLTIVPPTEGMPPGAILGPPIEGLPPGSILRPISPAITDSEFEFRKNAGLAEGTRIKNLAVNNQENALVALIFGAYGFPGGLVIWLFCRLIRFAVKG